MRGGDRDKVGSGRSHRDTCWTQSQDGLGLQPHTLNATVTVRGRFDNQQEAVDVCRLLEGKGPNFKQYLLSIY